MTEMEAIMTLPSIDYPGWTRIDVKNMKMYFIQPGQEDGGRDLKRSEGGIWEYTDDYGSWCAFEYGEDESIEIIHSEYIFKKIEEIIGL